MSPTRATTLPCASPGPENTAQASSDTPGAAPVDGAEVVRQATASMQRHDYLLAAQSCMSRLWDDVKDPGPLQVTRLGRREAVVGIAGQTPADSRLIGSGQG